MTTPGEQASGGEPAPCRRCNQPPGQPHEPIDGDCVLSHRHDLERHPPKARTGWICNGCVNRHRETLTQITELWALLPTVVDLGSVPDNTAQHKRTKQTGSPAMVRLQAWAMLYGRLRRSVHAEDDDGHVLTVDGVTVMVETKLGHYLPNVPRLLHRWAVKAVRAGAERTSTAPLRTVSSAVVQLNRSADVIACQLWVDEYDTELRWILRALNDAHGIETAQPLGPCLSVRNGRECGGKVREQAGDIPRCDRCKRRYGTHDLVRMQLDQGARGRTRPPVRHLRSDAEGPGRA